LHRKNFLGWNFEDIAMTDDPWLKTSIMAKRGVAKGQAGKRHELTIEKQGPFHYVYGPYANRFSRLIPAISWPSRPKTPSAASSPARKTSPQRANFPSHPHAAQLPSAD